MKMKVKVMKNNLSNFIAIISNKVPKLKSHNPEFYIPKELLIFCELN